MPESCFRPIPARTPRGRYSFPGQHRNVFSESKQSNRSHIKLSLPSTKATNMKKIHGTFGYALTVIVSMILWASGATPMFATAAPSITSVSPNPVTGSSSTQPFTIYGNNFVSGCNVTLQTGGVSYPNRTIGSFSSTAITINPNFTTTAATWTVQVINPSGQASAQYSFTVNAPAAAPSITSVSPNPVTGASSTQPFTIYGGTSV